MVVVGIDEGTVAGLVGLGCNPVQILVIVVVASRYSFLSVRYHHICKLVAYVTITSHSLVKVLSDKRCVQSSPRKKGLNQSNHIKG